MSSEYPARDTDVPRVVAQYSQVGWRQRRFEKPHPSMRQAVASSLLSPSRIQWFSTSSPSPIFGRDTFSHRTLPMSTIAGTAWLCQPAEVVSPQSSWLKVRIGNAETQ